MRKTTKKLTKKPTKLEAKLIELEQKVKELEALQQNQVRKFVPTSPGEPETFEDCVQFHKTAHDVFCTSTPIRAEIQKEELRQGKAVPSEKRAKQLLAISKIMTVADALNHLSLFNSYWSPIIQDGKVRSGLFTEATQCLVRFTSQHSCEKAIKILGEETIKTAFGL